MKEPNKVIVVEEVEDKDPEIIFEGTLWTESNTDLIKQAMMKVPAGKEAGKIKIYRQPFRLCG